jgi:predicted ABC-type ATPase
MPTRARGHSHPHKSRRGNADQAFIDAVSRRRYVAGLRNLLALYLPAVDLAMIFDNSDEGRVIIAEWIMETGLVVRDRARWARIEEAAT